MIRLILTEISSSVIVVSTHSFKTSLTSLSPLLSYHRDYGSFSHEKCQCLFYASVGVLLQTFAQLYPIVLSSVSFVFEKRDMPHNSFNLTLNCIAHADSELRLPRSFSISYLKSYLYWPKDYKYVFTSAFLRVLRSSCVLSFWELSVLFLPFIAFQAGLVPVSFSSALLPWQLLTMSA